MSFDAQRIAVDYHIVGFRECATEVARYLVTMEGMDIQDPLRLRLMSHLQCFVAQRELQLKSNGSGVSDPLSPSSAGATAATSAVVVNPISPNMSQSTANWATPTSYQQGYHQHHPHHQQMMQTTYQQQQQQQQHHNAYASQTAAAQNTGGYVPNLPQYDQYGNSSINARVEANYDGATGNASSATVGGASTTTSAGGRSGVTTRSQANNTNNNQSTATSNSSTSASTGNDVNGEQNEPTYTDLTSSSAVAAAAVSSASSSASEAAAAVSSVSSSAGNNRLNNNYNIYGHIHYPVDSSSFGGHHYHHGYNLHLGGSAAGSINGGGLQMDLSSSRGSGGGYNVVPGNGNSKPYRPWGAEMAY